ncbi:MAG TPA: carboxypeptidase-like regulatory domain-containing protein [Terracidiphilus sp.]|nr:carboxypeptidase-like regulatory domain-containing protein [Terracidiphilus sp.]
MLCFAVLAIRPAAAQTFAGSISGTVTDATGAVVVGAKLQLQNTNTKDTRLETSDQNGSYHFTNLLPGTYEISASAAGFKDFLQTAMTLNANTAAIVDIHLEVGNAQERVEVSASGAVLLDTASANNSVTLPSRLIQNLPNNTLQPLSFVYALAGTTEAQGGMTSRSASTDQMFSTFGINGGRTAESLILIDGASSTAIDWGGLMVSPMQDSVSEQQVIQNVYDAQYERGGEGVVTLVTKSGTGQFHGEAYDFMRNNGLDANSWGNNFWGTPRGKFHRQQFGGNLGGPLWAKHNLFFFGAYEGLREPGSSSVVDSVPTAAERTGDFSNSPYIIYNPFTQHQVTDSTGTYWTRDQFPGNKIPSQYINPVGQKLANLYGLPTIQGNSDRSNFVKQGPNTNTNDKFDWRIDWSPGSKNRIFARMSDRLREGTTPPCYFCNGADNNYSSTSNGAQVVVNDTWTPTSNWVVDTYGAWSRWLEQQNLIGYGKATTASVGLPSGIFQLPIAPIVDATGYTGLGNRDSTLVRYARDNSTGIINITRQLSRHTLKFGFNYDVNMINNRKDAPGQFSFSGQFTSCQPNPTGTACKASNSAVSDSGNAIADLLLGTGTGGGMSISMDPAFSAHTLGTYAQDDWKLTPRMTISVGLRYENQRPATERYNRIAYFDPKAVNPISAAYGKTLYGAFEYAGTGDRGREAWQPDNADWGPRAGIAYRITDKLLGRIGAGMFYGPSSAMLSFDGGGQSPGYTSSTTWNATTDGFTPLNLVDKPFPAGINLPTGNKLGTMTLVGSGNGQIWPWTPHPAGRIYQWSMDFQYQVSAHAVGQIGYTGVRGRKLLFGNPNFDMDQLPDQYLSLGSQLDQTVNNPLAPYITDPTAYLHSSTVAYNATLRPFPEYGWINLTRSLPGARSQFDALNARYDYTFHNGLVSITTFQWSKNMDNGSEALLGWSIGGSWRDYYNQKADYGLSTHDLPVSFVETWYYELPYGTGRQFGAAAPQFLRQTVGGWNVAGVVRLTSGMPLWEPVSFGSSGNHLNNYGFPGNALPDLIGNPKPHNRSRLNWINPAAFQGLAADGVTPMTCNDDSTGHNCQSFPFRYGNEPQHYGTLREAGNKNADLSVSKDFGTERYKVQLRGDFLNAFNHPVYGGSWNFNSYFGWENSGQHFGQVSGTRNDPRNIQLALKFMF